MKKIVPLGKRSKKAQREYHRTQRGSWNGVCPITRTVPSRKAYDRSGGRNLLRPSTEKS